MTASITAQSQDGVTEAEVEALIARYKRTTRLSDFFNLEGEIVRTLRTLLRERRAAQVAVPDITLEHRALELALRMLAQFEPGDSRAVSNEFVAMAAIHSGLGDVSSCVEIIDAALAAAPPPPATEQTHD